MLKKLDSIEKRFTELEEKISLPEIIAQKDLWQKYLKEHSALMETVNTYPVSYTHLDVYKRQIQKLDFPVVAFRITGVHPHQVCRKKGGLLTTGPGPYLDNHIFFILSLIHI